ncbi:MAG: hypothetical protein WC212_00315 [Candidatus Delongbacteria bacterium]
MWKENLPDKCPPIEAIEMNNICYRVLKKNEPSEKDFIPLFKDSPRYRQICQAYAISFFDTYDNAVANFYKTLEKGKVLGNYIAEYSVIETDGRQLFNRKNGHISVWFYSTWNLNNFIPINISSIYDN